MSYRYALNVCLTALMVSLLSACNSGSSGDPASNSSVESAPFSDDSADIAALAGLLSTGADGDDTQSYWECQSTSFDGSTVQYPLRLWRNNSGYMQEQKLRWLTTSPSGFELTSNSVSTEYSAVELQTILELHDTLVATGSDRSNLYCKWSGPSRYNPAQIILDDGVDVQNELLQELSERSWGCTIYSASGSVQSTILQLKAGGSGSFDGTERRWYFGPDGHLYLSDGMNVDLLSQIIVTDGATHSFTAAFHDSQIDCTAM